MKARVAVDFSLCWGFVLRDLSSSSFWSLGATCCPLVVRLYFMRENKVSGVCPKWPSWDVWIVLSCTTSSSIHVGPFHTTSWGIIWLVFLTSLCRSKQGKLKAAFVPGLSCKYMQIAKVYLPLVSPFQHLGRWRWASFLFFPQGFQSGSLWSFLLE